MTAEPTVSPSPKDFAAWDQASVLDLAADLVRIPTRGGVDDYQPAVNLLIDHLFARIPHGVQILGTLNNPLGVTATLDFGPGPHYVLDACLDTADIGDRDAWDRDPFSGDLANGWLHGRGSSDSKAAVSIFTHLAARIAHETLRGKLTVLFDLDEHTGGFGGIKAWLAQQEAKPDGVMIGYPGPDKVVIGGRGVWRAEITVHGEAVHSGSSRTGHNAISRATWLADLLGDEVPTWLSGGEDFSLRPKLTVTSIQGGAPGSFSVVPDVCTLQIDVRLTPTFTATDAERLVAIGVHRLDGDRSAQHLRPTVVTPIGEPWPAYRTDDDHPMVQALRHGARLAGLDPKPTVAGPSNIGCHLAQHGIPATAGFGVNYRGLHAANEAIEVASIPAVYASYYEAVRVLLG